VKIKAEKELFQSTEGRILIIGIILLVLLISGLGYCAGIDLSLAKILTVTGILNGFAGRGAGVGLCILNGYGPLLTISYNIYIEITVVCFTYSLFVLTANNIVQVQFIRKLMKRLEAKAEHQKDKIESYGWIGIFLFVMVPLPVTGPVMGTIIGYMLKMRLFSNFTAAITGTLSAIIIWFYCFEFLDHRFKVIQYIIAGIIILVLAFKYRAIKDFFKTNKR
jgi:uncharacterized membrane protein